MLSVLSGFAVGFAVCDDSGRVLLADDAYADIFGCSKSQVTGISRDNVTHPEDLGRNLLLIDRFKRDGQPFEITKRYLRADGSPVWVENRISRLHGDQTARMLVLSRPSSEAESVSGVCAQAGRLSLAGVISDICSVMSLQARRHSRGRTAYILDKAADAAIPEAQRLSD